MWAFPGKSPKGIMINRLRRKEHVPYITEVWCKADIRVDMTLRPPPMPAMCVMPAMRRPQFES